jgi:hypothetical protein
MVNKIIDRFANLARSWVNKTTEHKYENLINSADFRSLYSRYGYKNEEEWISNAREMIKKDPKKFADILSYDVTKSDLRKHKII